MKKTLIALAAVAAATAASAQVTIGGNFAYGYKSATTNGSTDSGFGVDTAAITVSGTDDLGGGVKLSASMVFAGASRSSGSADGENFTMAISSGMGTLTVGAVEIGSGTRGLAQAGAPVNNMEGEILGAAADYDLVKYTAPSFNGFTFSASLTEDGTHPELGSGTDSADATGTTVGVAYAAGALKAMVDYSKYSNHANDYRMRAAAQYDLGVAVIGAGYENTTGKLAADDARYTMVGVSMPLNAAATVGAVFATRELGTAATLKGYSVGASYNLSKRTSLTADYSNWEVASQAKNDSKVVVLLNSSF